MATAGPVEERYLKLHDAGEFETKCEREQYDMNQRLKFAKLIAEDGKKVVADLGSLAGGMSYALKEYGVRAISTDIRKVNCKRIKERGINEDVVLCNSFKLPIRDADALVSYMFLGAYAYPRLKINGISKVFDELSRSADTIYSVELKAEYQNWFRGDPETATGEDAKFIKNVRALITAGKLDEAITKLSLARSNTDDQIKEKLDKALPDFKVEYLGEFGEHRDEHLVRGRFMDGDVALDEHTEERLGFKFTNNNNTQHGRK